MPRKKTPSGHGHEHVDPRKRVYGTPEGTYSNKLNPEALRKTDLAREMPSAIEIIRQRFHEILKEAEGLRKMLMKSARAEALAMCRVSKMTNEEVLAIVEERRADRRRRIEKLEHDGAVLLNGLQALEHGGLPEGDFLNLVDRLEECAAADLDAQWGRREAAPSVYTSLQERLRALSLFRRDLRARAGMSD